MDSLAFRIFLLLCIFPCFDFFKIGNVPRISFSEHVQTLEDVDTQSSQKNSIAEVMPAMALLAGDSALQELQSEKRQSTGIDNDASDHDSINYWSVSVPDCPEHYFYHSSGKRCVPVKCDGAAKRNPKTGQCDNKSFEVHRVKRAYFSRGSGCRETTRPPVTRPPPVTTKRASICDLLDLRMCAYLRKSSK